MGKIYAWKTGAALGIAIAVGYTVLTVLFALWPLAGNAFHTAVTTGAGFDPSDGKSDWSFGSFIYALALLIIWGFATGALFAWVHSFLHRSDT